MDTWNKSDHGCMLRCTVAGSGLYGNVSSCFDHSRAQLIKGSELHFISNPSVLCLRADTTQQPATDATTLKHSSLRVSSLSALCTRFFVCTFLLTFLFFKDYFLPFYSIVETGGKHKERVTCNKAPPPPSVTELVSLGYHVIITWTTIGHRCDPFFLWVLFFSSLARTPHVKTALLQMARTVLLVHYAVCSVYCEWSDFHNQVKVTLCNTGKITYYFLCVLTLLPTCFNIKLDKYMLHSELTLNFHLLNFSINCW